MPAPAVGPGPDQGERLEDGVVAGRRARLAGRRVHRVGAKRVIVRDRDRRLAARLRARVHVEHRDAVPGRGVAARRPGRVLHRVGARPVIDAGGRGQHRAIGHGEHFRLVRPPRRGRAEHIQVRVGPAAAEDQVHGALAGVEDAAVHRRHRVRPPGVRRARRWRPRSRPPGRTRERGTTARSRGRARRAPGPPRTGRTAAATIRGSPGPSRCRRARTSRRTGAAAR